ncbi:hypothetical protein EAX61_15300 [Dokdonia sinensis]|uniref:Histidine kinase domain-containing protein n=1 Tax=Dokdonia sinensis TaxID=2479847 RepID=A0A3M0FU88_9FLAO|nr:histidine kinase dimerization/phosphoacceptor domain -containing protein [Dokdonia sinensis]RMB56221.1 hypothetical protein EAX61_15300 [Dokdonia sinensis]
MISEKTVDTLEVVSIDQNQGLKQLNVRAVVQDDLDYIWVGTEDGVQRYDGYGFISKKLSLPDGSDVQDNYIEDLHFTKDTLWIGTLKSGVLGYKLSEDRFFDVAGLRDDSALLLNRGIIAIDDENLLFSSENQFGIYNRKSKSFERFTLPESKNGAYVTDAVVWDEDEYILGTSTEGAFRFNKKKNAFTPFNEIPKIPVNALLWLDNQLAIGTASGLYLYDRTTGITQKTNITDHIMCLEHIDNMSIYIGSKTGLMRLENNETAQKIILKGTNGKVYDPVEIYEIHQDDKGNTWFGSEGEGMFYHNDYRKKFVTQKIKLEEYPSAIKISSFQFEKEADSTLWVATTFGVVKYDMVAKTSKLFATVPEEGPAYILHKDDYGNFWSGGYGYGVMLFDEKSQKFKQYLHDPNNPKSLAENDVPEIIPIDEKRVWVSSISSGIQEMNIAEGTFTPILINGEKINRTRTHFYDKEGYLWLGGDNGLYRYKEGEELSHFTSGDEATGGLSGKRIFGIRQASDNSFWVATNHGLTHLMSDFETSVQYTMNEGLPNNLMYTLEIDDNDNVWVSSNEGLSMLDVATGLFTNYTVKDGLQNNEFNGKCSYKDEFGNLYFGGVDGFNIFHPDRLKENPHTPEVHIDRVELFNSPLERNELFKDTLVFKSDENVITFGYTALNYLNPNKVSYQFKMEGFDETWRPETTDRTTTYTNLNPGTYRFLVKASNDVGIWNNEPDMMTVIVVPPWYQQWWFRVLAVVLFLLSGIMYYLYKTNKLKKDKLKLTRLVEERTQEVKEKNEALTTAYNESESQRERITFLMQELNHRVKNNLQIISSLLNIQAHSLEDTDAIEALQVAKQRILTISHIQQAFAQDDDAIHLSAFIKELVSAVLKVLGNESTPLFKVEYDLEDISVPSGQTTLIGLVLNELITNVYKYAFDRFRESNTLKISTSITEGDIILTLEDNGKGYAPKDMRQNSLGLELVNEMVRQLKGTLETQSEDGVKNRIVIPKPQNK